MLPHTPENESMKIQIKKYGGRAFVANWSNLSSQLEEIKRLIEESNQRAAAKYSVKLSNVNLKNRQRNREFNSVNRSKTLKVRFELKVSSMSHQQMQTDEISGKSKNVFDPFKRRNTRVDHAWYVGSHCCV